MVLSKNAALVLNITTQYLSWRLPYIFRVRVRTPHPNSTTRAHSNGNPTPARILLTAGHRPFPSYKPTVMLAGQTLSMATSISVPSRVACWLRTTNRSQRVHGDVRCLYALLVQPPLPCRSLSEHRSHQRLSWHNQENGQLRKSLPAHGVIPLFRSNRVLPRKLLSRFNASNCNIAANFMGNHFHRHSRLGRLRHRLRHLHVLQTKMVVHRSRRRRRHNRRSNLRAL